MPDPSFEQDLLNYANSKNSSGSGGESWGDYIFGRGRSLGSLVTDVDDSKPNIIDRGLKWYNENPYLGKNFDWVNDNNKYLDEMESGIANAKGGGTARKWAAKAYMAPERAKSWVLEQAAGNPVNAGSTAATLGTGALGKTVLKETAGRYGIPLASKALTYTGRGLDALQGLVGAGTAVSEASKGNYGTAAVAGLGTAAAGWGATGYKVPGKGTKVPDVIPDAVPETPAFLRSDPKFAARPVTPGVAPPTIDPTLPGKVVTIDGSMSPVKGKGKAAKAPAETLVTPAPKTQAEIDAVNNLVRQSQEPLRFSRPVTAPNAITDPARLLGEGTVDVAPPSARRASVISPADSGLMERAQRDLTAAGEEITAHNLERYRDVPDYRSRIQATATKAGKPGGYEAVVESGQVTPATAAPEYPAGIAPETAALLDAAKGRVDDEVATRVTKAVYDGTKNIPGHYDPTFPIGEALSEQLNPSDLAIARNLGLLDETHLKAVKNAQDRAAALAERQPPEIQLGSRAPVEGLGDDMPTMPPEPAMGDLVEPDAHVEPITMGDGEVTWRADTRTEKPYRFGDDPKLDSKHLNKVNRTLRNADKELAAITDPAERRVRLVEILGEKLTRNELGAAFEGGILNQKIVGEATNNRISRGIEESAMVPHTPPGDVTPNMGPANNMPPPGFAGRAVEAPTANGPMYWNQQSPEPISVNEGTFAGAPAQTPPQVSGLRQVMAEPGLAQKPVMRTESDVVQALAQRGVTEPTPETIAKILKDPNLLDKVVPPSSEFVPDVSRGFTPVQPPVTDPSKLIPENVPVVTNDWKSPEQITKILEAARKEKPRDVFGDNNWQRAQTVANNLGQPGVAQAIGVAQGHVQKTRMGWLEEGRKNTTMSMETELGRMGPAGEQAVLLKRQANTDAVIRFDEYVKDVADEVDALAPDRFEVIVDNLEGKLGGLTAKEVNLADRMREVLKQSGKDMDSRGMLDKGVIQDYWPHRFDGVPDKTIVDKLRAQGMSVDEAQRQVDYIRKARELKTAGEYSRTGNNLPGYRKDKQVFFEHLKAVSNRIELADKLGVKDTADPNSVISKLIAQTDNPERARDLMERTLRGGPQGTEGTRAAAHVARTYATGAMMNLSSVANMFGGALPIAVRGNIAENAKSLFKVIGGGSSPEMGYLKNVNRFNEFQSGIAEGMTTNKFNKWYGIDWTQNQVNKYAGSVGLGTAKSMFQELKANPNNKNIEWMLKDLVLEDAKTLLKQTELTDKQLKRAATRMVDITQGVVHNEKLPYAWVRSGLGTIPQIFQRINFQVTKAMKDGIAQAPASSLAKLGTMGLGLGEVIGDVKEIPKTIGEVGWNSISQAAGTTTEDKDLLSTYKENIGYGEKGTDVARFYNTKKWLGALNEDAAKNDHLVHAVNNLESSFAGGMPLNLLAAFASTMGKATPDPGGEAISNLFVAVDEGGKLLSEGANVVNQGIIKPLRGETPDFRDTVRAVTRRLPIPGGVQSGVIREIDTTKQHEKGGGRSGGVWGNAADFR